MIIQHNMQAMNANRMLGGIVTSQSKVTEKLSSGYRINRAGDDAAGLSISEKMRAQINGLNRASTNAQDAISLIQTAEGALTETHSILQRMRELSVQAATDTNVEEDREALQAEVEQLTSEINRIAKTTQFNGMNLLDGTRSADYVKNAVYADVEYFKTGDYDVMTATGVTNGVNLSMASGIEFVSDADIKWDKLDGAASSTNEIKLSKSGNELTVAIKAVAKDTTLQTIDITDKLTANEDGDYEYDQHGVKFTITKEEYEAWDDSSNVTVNLTTVTGATSTNVGNATTQKVYVDEDYANGKTPKKLAIKDVSVASGTKADTFGDNVTIKVKSNHGTIASSIFTVTLEDDTGNVIDTVAFTKTAANPGNIFTYDNHGLSFKLDLTAAVTNTADSEDIEVTLDLKDKLKTDTVQEVVSAEEESDNSLNFQVGANANQIINVSLGDMSAAALGVSSKTAEEGFGDEMSVATDGVSAEGTEYALDLTSRANANKAIDKLDGAIKKVSEQRSALGAVQNRLEHTIANLDTSAENLQAAESRIRDVDMAEEMVEYSKNNILQQAAQSMLAQANQSTQGVLSLLQ